MKPLFRFPLTNLLLLLFAFAVGVPQIDAQPTTKRVLFQGFWWDYYNNNFDAGWANYLTELAPRLREMGVDAIWIPPTVKNEGGTGGVGYAPFDHYDLGDKFQKNTLETRLGTKDELLRMVAVMHANGIEVIQDIVPNHVIGAGDATGAGGEDPTADGDKFKNFRYTSWATPATDNSASDYLARSGRFPKNKQNFHPNPGHNCSTGDICGQLFGPDVCYEPNAFGQSSNATHNPPQSSLHMRNGYRAHLVWQMKQMGYDGIRMDAVKHFPTNVAEDFIANLQLNTDFMARGDAMFAVGEWVGGTSEVDDWYDGVQGRAGVFDFNLRAFGNGGGLRSMVYGQDNFDMATLPGLQQTESKRIHVNGFHRTTPFVNNHDTFRPTLDADGNYVYDDPDNPFAWKNNGELSRYIEPKEPRLAAAYAVIFAMDGNPQVFFEDLFNIGYNSDRYTHQPSVSTSLVAREDLVNIMQAHQKLDFKGGNYFVRSAEPNGFDGNGQEFGVSVIQGQLSDHLVIERGGKALIGITDKWDVAQEVFVDTDFPPGTILQDYSGANGTDQYVVPTDGRVLVLTQPVNFPAGSGDYHGYSIWAPVPGNVPFTSVAAMQTYLNSPASALPTTTTQEWEMADDLGDSHCQSLGQGGALPAGSANQRTVGKIFVQSGTTVTYLLTPDDNAPDVTLFFQQLDGTELHSANGTNGLSGSFSANTTGWIAAKIRNTNSTNAGQNVKVRLTYTAPTTVDTDAFPAANTVAIWTGNAGTSDQSECRNWEEGLLPAATSSAPIVPAYASPQPAAALPVELLAFAGTERGENAVLNWTTGWEANNRGFRVERSAEGRNFREIGFVRGAGNADAENNYRFVDRDFEQDQFYRLVQVDFDGVETVGSVVFVRKTVHGEVFKLVPNPAAGVVQLRSTVANDVSLRIQISSADGRRTLDLRGDVNRVNQRLGDLNLPDGVYSVEVRWNGQREMLRLVILR